MRRYGSHSITCYFTACEIISKRNFTIIYEMYINNGGSNAQNETWSPHPCMGTFASGRWLTGTADTINCLHLWGRWRRIPRPFLFLVGKASLAHLEDPSFDDHTVILLHMGDKSSIHDHIRILKQCQLFIVQKSFDR